MPVAPGAKVGPYEILNLIGAGGMGVVYRARDPRLNRDIALKTLPQLAAADSDRLRRFTLEARSAGALNHPNILAIYDVGTQDGAPYIVSELLEGESLRERLSGGKLGVTKAVELARQAAHGLAAAHAKGITHRDIKPENLFITSDGHLKILDFGLAKLRTGVAGGGPEAETRPLETQEGSIVGTVAYMSPEQVRGEVVDHRSDIFSLGTVMHEMLTGQRPFRGATSVETLNAILKEEPPGLSTIDGGLPPGLDRIVRHCLEKNPAARCQSAGDLAFDLEALSSVSAVGAAKAVPGRGWRGAAIVSSVLALAAIAGAFVLAHQSRPALRPSVVFSITLPADAPLAAAGRVSPADDRPALALSPDGLRLAYVAQTGDHTKICLREMTTGRVSCLAGTEGGHTPIFSPDGNSLAFFADDKLRKIACAGGAVAVLADAPTPWGAVWGTDGSIYFNRYEGEGIFRIPEGGGSVQAASTGQHFMPELLGSGQRMLVTVGTTTVFVDGVSPPKPVVAGISARYAPSGHLVYATQGKLMAVPFDPAQATVTGPSVSLFEDLRTQNYGVAQFALGKDGTLIYVSGQPQMLTSFVWVDRAGRTESLGLPKGLYSAFDLSPDGKRLAISVAVETGQGETEIWICDLPSGALSRLTSRTSAGQISTTQTGPAWLYPMSFSMDGSVMAVFGPTSKTSFDLFLMNVQGPSRTLSGEELPLFLGTPFGEAFGQISPDGRWMLYSSDQSGKSEIYVTSYPKPGAVHQVSRGGGREPVWNPSAPEILYVEGLRMYAVNVSTNREFRAGEPRLLFDGPYPNIPGHGFDITADGRRLLMLESKEALKPTQTLTVVTNFFDELRRRVPAGQARPKR